jgi:riboflavin kinase/FMN adenylyltransferase
MRRVLGLDSLTDPPPRSAVCIGKFFAVHRGHQALLRATVAAARRREAAAVVLTFDRHPRELLQPGYAPRVLTSLEERLDLIAGEGLDLAVVLPLTAALLAQEPEAFARDTLASGLRAVEVLAGESFRFGRGARGDAALLRRLGSELGFDYAPVAAVLDGGAPVSSSRVADAIEAGAVAEAARLLGRPYSTPGEVVAGEKRGRELGFPTANVSPPAARLLPADGVYVARLWVEGPAPLDLPAVANLGVRPTVDGRRRVLEVHALGWGGDLYGRAVRVAFLERLREERRFADLDALRGQIARDAQQAAAWFGSQP